MFCKGHSLNERFNYVFKYISNKISKDFKYDFLFHGSDAITLFYKHSDFTNTAMSVSVTSYQILLQVLQFSCASDTLTQMMGLCPDQFQDNR